MALRDVIRNAYANAGPIADQARAEGRDAGDVFDIMAAAVEARYGPMIDRTIFYEGGTAVVEAEWFDGREIRGQALRVPEHVYDEVRHEMLRRGVLGATQQVVDDQHKAGRLPVQHRMGARVLQLAPQWFDGRWVPHRDEPPA